jgi:TolB protein
MSALSWQLPRRVHPWYSSAAAGLIGIGLTTACSGHPGEPSDGGSLMVMVLPGGSAPAPERYGLLLDGASAGSIRPNAPMTLIGLEVGEHLVGLQQPVPGCSVVGENPRQVLVTAGETRRVDFAVTCSPVRSILEVRTHTTGLEPFPASYEMALDGGVPRSIGVTAALTIPDLDPGDHLILLTGLGTNCAVTGSNPLSLRLVPDSTTRAEFAVTCFASRGSVRVETATSGRDPDLDGYTISLDDGPSRPIGSSDSAEFAAVPSGTHRVRLTDLAPYCFPAEPDPQMVEVRGEEATLRFTISCPGASSARRLLYAEPKGADTHLFAMTTAGTDRVDLTPDASGYGGRWSPDGSRIVFESYRNGVSEVFLMKADGSDPMRLAAGSEPAWSPDGRRIVFVAGSSLAIMNSDGSSPIPLGGTAGAAAPAWSPDGRTIVFSAVNRAQCGVTPFFDVICARDIYAIAPDGTGRRQLTEAGSPYVSAHSPVWSPDGSHIAYSKAPGAFTVTNGDVYLMAADGTGQAPLTAGTGTDAFPVWSPDGQTVAFATAPTGSSELDIALVPLDGGRPVTILEQPGEQVPTSWR